MNRPRPPHDAATERLPRDDGLPPRPRSWSVPHPGVLVATAVLAAGAGIVVFADLLGIDHRTPFVQLIAFRWQLAAGLVVLGAVVALLVRALRPVAVALLLVGVLGLLTVAPRVVPTTADTGVTEDTAGGGALTVMVLNVYLGRADVDDLAALVRDRRPDVVVLPEARSDLRRRLASALTRTEGVREYRSAVADRDDDESPMTVLVARDLGRPRITVDRDTEFPWLVVDLPDGLRVVGVHTMSPRPGDTRAWQRDLAALDQWCSDGRPTIVAGDFNASFDHAELRDATEGCSDAASEVGDGLYGTWPAQLPGLLGAQIDHVLLAGGPRAESVEFVEVGGTDHRAVLARVTPG